MTSKKELKFAYRMAIILMVLGIFCYAAYSRKIPDTPMRMMFQSAAGKILFDHQNHNADYGLACIDCHHHYEEDETDFLACGDCHVHPDADPPTAVCLECHEEDEVDPGEDALKRADAFHDQCIGCHEENDIEPVECSGCHVM
ncbi:MAG: hypothetical protein B6I22_07785 [Desulfobacteraceae bacterium 4572_123]|nr:MAG: hypothetical protein B6I22_07785 [Desulfobacteraceae bacterium 4572_123]